MEKSVFNNKISNPSEYSLQEKLDIQSEKTHYPYCALLQMMDLLSDKAANIFHWEERFAPKVAMYMFDSEKMSDALQRVTPIDIISPEDVALKQRIEQAKTDEYSSEDPTVFDVMHEINTYQEVSFKTAPKSVILSKFLEDGNFQPTNSGVESGVSIEELAKKSVSTDNGLETETLALVLEKQGKYDKAIAIYEKLISNNPEKSSTFANRILELKNKENK